MICPFCKAPNDHTGYFCIACRLNMYGDDAPREKHRRPMTPWEQMKLTFYRSEKKWIENIRSRKQVKGRDGSRITISDHGAIPHSPAFLWPEPKRREK